MGEEYLTQCSLDSLYLPRKRLPDVADQVGNVVAMALNLNNNNNIWLNHAGINKTSKERT